MRVFLVPESKPGLGYCCRNVLGIPSHVELSTKKLPSWFFACGVLTKGFLCLKLNILTCIMLFVCTVGDRPELELYRDFCGLSPL